nr:RNA-directed DNA polymerase, eukaryota, reverse transcriptase zinc-binding domain protein [Tanacetum cinerariifolium]
MNKNNLMGISVDSNKVKHAAANIGASKYGIYSCADVNSKKPSWVRWKSVLAAKDVGGLGVSSLSALNRALMFKWVWKFFSQKNSLWVRVVKALHGEDGKIDKKVQPRYPSTWLNIINEIESLKLHGIDLVSFITLKQGNGANTSFWDVAWGGDISFKILVPRLRNPRGGVEQAQSERLKEMVEEVTLIESSRHLFFSYKMISDVMRKITRWWDLEYREINSFEEMVSMELIHQAPGETETCLRRHMLYSLVIYLESVQLKDIWSRRSFN